MMYCKNCSGKLYEEEIWFDENGLKMQEIGCYQCPKKIQVAYKDWVILKRKINNALIKSNVKSKS